MGKIVTRIIVKPLPEDETRDEDYVDLDKEEIYLSDGTRLTEEIAQKWAEEIETNPIYLGRPSLSGKREISPEVKARVPQRIKDFIEQIAEERNQSVSTIIRQALFEYIERNTEIVHEIADTGN